MFAAIVRAQLMAIRPRKGSRRAGALFSIVTGLVYYGFWTVVAAAVMFLFSVPANNETIVSGLSLALLFTALYWQLTPLLTASFGASLDLPKLILYPIPGHTLFLIEVLLRFMGSSELLLVIAGTSAGLLRNPRYGSGFAAYIIAGGIVFIAFNVLVAAGVRVAIERWFRTSRWKEIGFLLFVALCIAPQFLLRARFNIVRLAPSQLFWPWAAAARLMVGSRLSIEAAISAMWLALAWWFGRRQFFRSLRFDAVSGVARDAAAHERGIAESLFRIPSRFLADPLAAIVEKEMRMLLRISRVRVVFLIGGLVGVMLYLPNLTQSRAHNGPFFANALPILAVYALLCMAQVTYWNAFGFDRSAAMGYFCWPVRIRDVFIAKNIATAFLLLPQIAAVWVIAALIGLPASPGKFLEAVVAMMTSALYWFGVGNIASVRLAHAMDPDKMTQMSGKMQALSIWAAPVLLLPVFLAYFAREALESQMVFAAVMAIAVLLGAIFYSVTLDSAVRAASERREALLAELSRSAGPISTT